MNKKILIGSIIAVVLLTLVSFSSVVGYSSVKSNPSNIIITDELDFEYCKDYLFETLVEISNNEDVNELINSNNQNLFPSDSNHRLLMPFRRNTNRMSLSVEKLDLLYNMGKKLIDRLGEDKVAEIMENVEIDKPDYAEELDTIIMSNEELSERIYAMNKMNRQSGFEETLYLPIFCFILEVFVNLITFIGIFMIFNFSDINNFPILSFLFLPFFVLSSGIFLISLALDMIICG